VVVVVKHARRFRSKETYLSETDDSEESNAIAIALSIKKR
jgi:hypothetical protein